MSKRVAKYILFKSFIVSLGKDEYLYSVFIIRLVSQKKRRQVLISYLTNNYDLHLITKHEQQVFINSAKLNTPWFLALRRTKLMNCALNNLHRNTQMFREFPD